MLLGKKDFLIGFFIGIGIFFLYRMNLIELRDVKYLGCSFLERGLYVNIAPLECKSQDIEGCKIVTVICLFEYLL